MDLDRYQVKLQAKIKQIAVIRATGKYTDREIAAQFNLMPAGLARIVALPEYKELEQKEVQRLVSGLQDIVSSDQANLVKAYEVIIPESLKGLLDTVRQNRDLKARMEAIKEAFDRDPKKTFAKAVGEVDAAAKAGNIPSSVVAAAIETGNRIVASQQGSKQQPIAIVTRPGEA